MNRPEPASPTAGDAPALPDYEQDFDLWLRAQASLLRERKLELLDVDNLAEEVEDMSRSQHIELGSRLQLVLVHLLKLRFQPDHRTHSWLNTLDEQRDRIARLIENSPSLARLINDYAEREYRRAVRKTARETGLPVSTFPTTNPFTAAQLLDEDFVP
jgi:hypothetical protein